MQNPGQPFERFLLYDNKLKTPLEAIVELDKAREELLNCCFFANP
jgi:hypothetical protein